MLDLMISKKTKFQDCGWSEMESVTQLMLERLNESVTEC